MRRVSLAAGLAILALVWGGPLLGRDADSFAAHMLAHMGVVALAAPLIALGLAGSAADPVRLAPRLFSPVAASLVELFVIWAWHAPAARGWVEASSVATVLEQASFLLAGLYLWLSCLGGRESAARSAAGAFGLLLTTVHMTLLGALLALTSRPLYGAGEVSCLGIPLGALQDQQLGGIAMLLIGAAIYLAGGVSLLSRLVAAPRTGEAH